MKNKKILDKKILVSATAVRVPVLRGHSESVNIKCSKPIDISELKLIKNTYLLYPCVGENLNFLNSGKQLYWLKYKRPEIFKKIKKTLHLPQYLSYVFTGEMYSEYTSIGCHTVLWDYQKKKFSYSIKVADFYYKNTARILLDRIKKETSIKNLKIIELSKTNYRLLIGPFNDIKSLRRNFEKMDLFNFENLEVLKNV